jgi:SAM-dependent methyltransferase
MEMGPEEISGRLRAGQLVIDADFDVWLPDSVCRLSHRYWTQVGVTMRVSRWLQACGASTVLDVGSGAGKFCVIGALASGMSFTGVEQRGHLVDAARTLAARFGVTNRATFVHGDLDSVDFLPFDALYFYNPFGENIFPISERFDETVEISHARFARDVAKVECLLKRMPVGSHMVTYNSFGGRVPDSFDLALEKVAGINLLRLWRKAREEDTGRYWLELEDCTVLSAAWRSGATRT